MAIFEDARRAMEVIGQRFAAAEYFIPELVYAGEIMKEISALVKPSLGAGGEAERLGQVVLGTVAGDIHDIGKDIVGFMLDVNGFQVFDLGVDVQPERFVDTVKESGSTIVGLSAFLTISFQSLKDTVEAIEDAGLRDKVKIMIGGGPVDEQVRRYTGADAWGKDAMEAVDLAKSFVEGVAS
jgi:5-methyltetrahydrofolate--homocysteine methyltransferase